MKNNYYVYVYYRLDTNEPFYVGKGHGERWRKLKRKNKHFNAFVEKYPIAVVIERDDLTEEESFYWEEKIIEKLVFDYGFSIEIQKNDSKDHCSHLINQTWGGEGASGWSPNEETRKKMSNSHKGKKGICRYGKDNPNYGNYWTEEQKEEQRKKLTGKFKGELNPFYGKTHTKETKRKLGKSIICLTTKKIFFTAIEASIFYNCDNSNIIKCCKGKKASCGKYNGIPLKWKYLIWKHDKKYRKKREVK